MWVLDGQASAVAVSSRRKATTLNLETNTRTKADGCTNYLLLLKRKYLNYLTALKQGWPIATGIIEGACRNLVKGRLDLTNARWGLEGAEAILKLSALRRNRDFDECWGCYLTRENSVFMNLVMPITSFHITPDIPPRKLQP